MSFIIKKYVCILHNTSNIKNYLYLKQRLPVRRFLFRRTFTLMRPLLQVAYKYHFNMVARENESFYKAYSIYVYAFLQTYKVCACE